MPTGRHPLEQGAQTLRRSWPPGLLCYGIWQPPVGNGPAGRSRDKCLEVRGHMSMEPNRGIVGIARIAEATELADAKILES
jgi:hypothetical protein